MIPPVAIGGFLPLSLSDYPGKLAAVLFTQGCPLRCAYCHNPELLPPTPPAEMTPIDLDEIFALLGRRKPFLDGVCVTGGEPTIHPGLSDLLARLKKLGYLVKLDTNGIHPTAVEGILARDLVDYVAMDIKHAPGRYREVSPGSTALEARCQQTMQLLGASPVRSEFRTTVWPHVHSENALLAIAATLPRGTTYALQALRTAITLQPHLPTGTPLDLSNIAARIRKQRPDLTVVIRE